MIRLELAGRPLSSLDFDGRSTVVDVQRFLLRRGLKLVWTRGELIVVLVN